MSIAVTKVKCHLMPWNIYEIDVQYNLDDDSHSSLAASSLRQWLVTSSSSDEYCCDESEMSSDAMEHLRD
ncbi:unnamed protein product [Didymodactylos carnosus]|uniref:Uncharacterized protein n=1 Tax=Didymodactylos carnosus TaxID=1234261 RepID=A0A8S3A2Z7_9BILA|nr:unnamed protein product [Didymodactylos carnosus]